MKKWLFLIAGGILFSIFISRIDSRGFLWLQKISIESLICIIGINATVLFLKAWRWKYLLSKFNIHLQNRKIFYAVSVGMYLGLVSPGTSGEFGRMIKVPIKPGLGFLTIALEKVADLGVLLLISLGGILYWVSPNRGLLLVAIPSLIILSVMVLGFVKMRIKIFSWIEGISKRITKREIAWKEILACLGKKDILFIAISVSFLLWVIPGVQYYLICKAIHTDIAVKSIIISLYTPYLVGVLSMIPFGIGVFEIGASHLLGRMSSEQEAIGPSLLLFRLLTSLPLVLFGLGCFIKTIAGGRKEY